MVYAQPRNCPGEWDAQTPQRFWGTNGFVIVNKKRTCRIVDFACPADHWVKLEESEKKGKSFDFTRELKKPWNMKVTVIWIEINSLDIVTKGFVQGLEDLEIRGWVETIQTIALLKSARILRRVLETWEDLLSLKLLW